MRSVRALQLALVAALLFTVGCESNNKGKIEGTHWASMPGTVKGLKLSAGTLKLRFDKDGKLVYVAGPKTMTGTYSLGMADYVTLYLDEELAGKKTHTETVTIKADYLAMTDSDGTSLTFTKVK